MSILETAVPGYTRLLLTPYAPNIGAVIHELDLRRTDAAIETELRRALAEFQVLFLRGQDLTPEEQIGVARIFGDPDKAKAFFPRHSANPLVEVVEARAGAQSYGTDQWHADITFSANPPTGTVLHAREVPASGGDTLWVSAAKVYEALPLGLRPWLEELHAVHSFEHSGWPAWFRSQANGEQLYREARAANLPVVHPVIRTHPVSGRKLVYVNPNFTDRIQGLSRQESDALLRYLFSLFERPDYQARLRWEKGTVAIWDNRITQHYAVADYAPQYRLMHRVTFGEDQAF